MKTITVSELKNFLSNTPSSNLVDVRTPAEFETLHVPGARPIPLDSLNCPEFLAERKRGGDTSPIFLLCQSGVRAKKAAEKFAVLGCQDCLVVEGGTQAWKDAGYPVTRGERAVLPLDRQLQLAIGTIVLSGVLLAQFLHPAWIWLSGFAGCGMIFAGLSGICLLRSAIAKMPWNQGSKHKGACCGV